MIIRPAQLVDLDNLLPLFEEFCKESLNEYGMQVDANYLRNIATYYVDNTLVAEVDNKLVGIISGIIVDIPTSGGKVYQEVVWFVSKPYRKYGIKLLNALEDKCKNEGIKSIMMVAMANSSAAELERFYIKSGFKLLEKQYIKQLGG